MTREEMIEKLTEYCKNRGYACKGCLLEHNENCLFQTHTDETIKRNYQKAILNVIEVPEIKDSGARTVFETGACRDMQEDKGACELMPLDVVAGFMPDVFSDCILCKIEKFKATGDCEYLYDAVNEFCRLREWSTLDCLLEVSMLYKQGKEKYGAYNWQKGIPVGSFISSGVRHLLKFVYGLEDERHDRSFVWNMFGAIWTMNHRPKMIDIPFELLGSQEGEE